MTSVVSRWSAGGVLLVGLVALASASGSSGRVAAAQGQGGPSGLADAIPPRFEADPSWPKPLPEGTPWPDLTRAATSVAVDSHDHPWVFQVLSPAQVQVEAAGKTVPRLFEFDPQGGFLQSWGGPGTGYQWFEALNPRPIWPAGTSPEHGLFIDRNDNIWLAGNGHLVLKFSHDGKFLLQLGELWKYNGSNDHKLLGSPTDLAVDPITNEVYIADGYINRRVAVFDAETGAYKRHWGAYGKRTVNDFQLLKDQEGIPLKGGRGCPVDPLVACVTAAKQQFVHDDVSLQWRRPLLLLRGL